MEVMTSGRRLAPWPARWLTATTMADRCVRWILGDELDEDGGITRQPPPTRQWNRSHPLRLVGRLNRPECRSRLDSNQRPPV